MKFLKALLVSLVLMVLAKPAHAQSQMFYTPSMSTIFTGSFAVRMDQDAATGFTVTNNNNTSSAQAYFGVQNSGQNVYLALTPSGWGSYHPGFARITGANNGFDLESDTLLNFFTGGYDDAHKRGGILNNGGWFLGTGPATANDPLWARYTIAGRMRLVWENQSTDPAAFSEFKLIQSDNQTFFGSLGSTSSDVSESNTFYFNHTGPAAGPAVSNTDFWECVNNGSNCKTVATGNVVPAIRFATHTQTWTTAQRGQIDENGMHVLNVPAQPTIGADVTPNYIISTTSGTPPGLSEFGTVRTQVTLTPVAGANCAASFKAAALTADCTIATLKAGQKLIGIYVDVTQGFACSGTCSGTKTIMVGSAGGSSQALASGLSVAATTQYGLADADLGSSMTRAAAIQGGWLPSWSGTTNLVMRFTSGTGNWGNGSATFVNAGAMTITIITQQVK